MLESGIDPATVRFEVGECPYCKYRELEAVGYHNSKELHFAMIF